MSAASPPAPAAPKHGSLKRAGRQCRGCLKEARAAAKEETCKPCEAVLPTAPAAARGARVNGTKGLPRAGNAWHPEESFARALVRAARAWDSRDSSVHEVRA